MAESRGQFSSKLGFILAAAGSAVGLGNIVAFPVMASKNGGAAFLIIYLLFIAFICYPVMLAEISMGRHTNRNPVGAFSDLSEGHPGWRLAGILAILTPFMIAVFYTVITVWLVVYVKEIAFGRLDLLSNENTFGEVVARPSLFGYLLGLLGLIFTILLGGVKGGIERLARILMPTLAVMLVALTLFVLTLDNAVAGIRYYLVPDFSRMDLSVINGALSQAFFSLSLGMGILITYGSYFSQKDSISQSTRMVAVADTSIAFFAGLLILPAIFAFDPNTNTDDLSTSSVGTNIQFSTSDIFVYAVCGWLLWGQRGRDLILLTSILCRPNLASIYHRDPDLVLDRRAKTDKEKGGATSGSVAKYFFHTGNHVSWYFGLLYKLYELWRCY